MQGIIVGLLIVAAAVLLVGYVAKCKCGCCKKSCENACKVEEKKLT